MGSKTQNHRVLRNYLWTSRERRRWRYCQGQGSRLGRKDSWGLNLTLSVFDLIPSFGVWICLPSPAVIELWQRLLGSSLLEKRLLDPSWVKCPQS